MEADEQMALFQWAAFATGKYQELNLLYHIPNGGSRNRAEAARLKAQGVKAGVPDLHLPVARGGYHSLYIEMKYGKNKTSPQQDDWLRDLGEQGNATAVCYNWEAAAQVLQKYLDLEDKQDG